MGKHLVVLKISLAVRSSQLDLAYTIEISMTYALINELNLESNRNTCAVKHKNVKSVTGVKKR